MKQTILTHEDVFRRVRMLSEEVATVLQYIKVFPVPRGGVPVAYALNTDLKGLLSIVDDPAEATLIVDDIIDSGRTLEHYAHRYPGTKFLALVDKRCEKDLGWVTFPWEKNESNGIEDNFVRLLQYIGEDPKRGGLVDTPARMAKAWKEYTSGYGCNPADVLKTFEDGGENYNEMVIVRGIEFYSHCEHHLAPFFGQAHVAYIPNGRVVGLSKIPRLVDIFARRLQVQERITVQIADAIMGELFPRGVGVMLEARHMCIESRGVHKTTSLTRTTALRGVFLNQPEVRDEFLRAVDK